MRRILLVILLTLSYSVSFSNQTETTGQAQDRIGEELAQQIITHFND